MPRMRTVLAQISLCALHASLLCQGYIIREGTAWHIISCRSAALQPAKLCMCSVRRPCRLLTKAKQSGVCVCGFTNVVFVAHGTSLTRHLIPILAQPIRSDRPVIASHALVSAVTSRVVVRHPIDTCLLAIACKRAGYMCAVREMAWGGHVTQSF